MKKGADDCEIVLILGQNLFLNTKTLDLSLGFLDGMVLEKDS